MDIKHTLVLSAVAGMWLGATGCGGSSPPAADPTAQGSTAQPAAKASCSGPDHTDKNHCSAASGAATPPK